MGFNYLYKSTSLYLSLDTCEEVPQERGLAAGGGGLVMLMLVAARAGRAAAAGEGVVGGLLLRVHLHQSEAV